MWQEVLNKIIHAIIMTIGISSIAKNLLKSKEDKPNYRVILIFLIITILGLILPSNFNNTIRSIMTISLICLSIRLIFKTNVVSTIIIGMATSVIMTVSRIIISLVISVIEATISIKISNNLINDIGIVLIGILLSRIKYFSRLTNKFINGLKINKFEIMLLCFLTFTITFFNYQIFIIRYIDGNSVNLVIYVVIFSLLFFIYMYNQIRYKDLTKQYKTLLEYSCTFEEELERDKLIRHEYKNQLVIIRSMTKNKKVIDYTNSIIKNLNYDHKFNIKGINNLPKGGLRGLIYYKLLVMKHKNICFSLDVDKNISKKINKLTKDDFQTLSYIIGICTDNAIEESSKKENSNISIEIYSLVDEISFVISNTINDKINIKKIGNKGYTTKGKSHGNGLYLIKKLLNNNSNITMNYKVINNYFVQEVKVRVM